MSELKFWVSAQVSLDERLAKRHAALVQAGVSKSEIVKRALVKLLDQEPVALLTDMGLAERLTKPELVAVDKYEYELVPEIAVVAAGQGKK